MAQSSGNAGKFAVLLLLLCGGLGWNYQRNAAIEATAKRPYSSYSDAQLEQLMSVQKRERERRDALVRTSGSKTVVRDRPQLSDRVAEFERVQKIGMRQRALADHARDSAASLAMIEAETAQRERDRPVYKKIVRRMFTFSAI